MNAFGRGPQILTLISAAAALGLSACGGSDDTTASTDQPQSAAGGQTVAVSTIGDAGAVLVDAAGDALYTPDQEAGGAKIVCTGSCESEWMPLTVDGRPSASADLAGALGTARRPDGSRQVTFDGNPLYSFVEDGGPGNVTGDGFTDQFDGRTFTWHVATPSGPSAGGGATASGDTGGGYGGY